MSDDHRAASEIPLPDEDEKKEAASRGMRLAMWARRFPHAPAVISPTGNRTFAELNANINRLARALRARGLVPGDAVAIVCGNRPAFIETVMACLRAGLRYTPVNWHLTADEIAYIVNDCRAKAVLGDVRYGESLAATVPLCPETHVWLAVGGDIEGFESYDDALAEQEGEDLNDPVLGSRMLYTSGTTGRPKGVVRPPNYSTHLEAITSAPRYQAGVGQMNLCTGPYYHGGPLSFSLTAPLVQGVGVVLMERWDSELALQLIEEHRITHTHMVPIMFHRMLRLPEEVRSKYDVSSMQYLLHGAAKCPIATKEAMLDWFGPILWEYFAATEGAGASVGPEDWRKKPGTVGRPPTPEHVRILDDEGNECPPGEAGGIYIKRGDADFEYWGDPEKTENARRGGYFSVGDIGYIDEDGFLFVTDRGANIIVSGGVNIYPAQVEAVLLKHAAVHDVAVIGIPNEEWGEEVKGVVEYEGSEAPAAALADELIAYCRAHLAHFKCPRTVDFVDKLPRLDNGKLYRNKLRAQYRAATARTGTT